MKDKYMRNYAEMQNVMDRTKRDAENSKKFAIQVCLIAASFNAEQLSSWIVPSYTVLYIFDLFFILIYFAEFC